jgi:hypothetical protein
MDPSLRKFSPRDHDRVNELLVKYPCNISKFSTQLQVVKVLKNHEKYIDVIDKIEKLVAKNAGYNFILRNIPDYGELSETGDVVKIGYSHIKDTMEKFGNVYALEIIKSTVYVKFDEPDACHSLVNNMMMGSNIITSLIV